MILISAALDWRINVSPFLRGPGQNGSVFFCCTNVNKKKRSQKGVKSSEDIRKTALLCGFLFPGADNRIRFKAFSAFS